MTFNNPLWALGPYKAELGPNTTSNLSMSSFINGRVFPYAMKNVGSI